jgi:holo-[acyl-carrier protein] synthase
VIIGVGTDICDARRISAIRKRFGQRFERRLFTPYEISQKIKYSAQFSKAEKPFQAKSYSASDLFFAKRFAAKEATAKAMGTGIRGFNFNEIEILNDTLGAPYIRLLPRAQNMLTNDFFKNADYRFSLSLSDEDAFAIAFVVLQRLH